MQYRIVQAEYKDAETLNELVNSAYRGEHSKIGWTTEADLLGGIRIDKTRLEALLLNPMVTFLKCVDEEGIVIGCVHLDKQSERMYLRPWLRR